MTTIKLIAGSLAALLLVPVLVIGAMAGGFGDGAAAAGGASDGAALPGDLSDLQASVLAHPGIHLTPAARGDVESGIVDPRVLQVLLLIAQTHEFGPVGPFVTGHSYYVKGTTRVSNHAFGRAVDILGVDGAPVSPANEAARELMEQLLTLDPPLEPDEIGGPWIVSVGARSSFTNADHLDHIHIGWDTKP